MDSFKKQVANADEFELKNLNYQLNEIPVNGQDMAEIKDAYSNAIKKRAKELGIII